MPEIIRKPSEEALKGHPYGADVVCPRCRCHFRITVGDHVWWTRVFVLWLIPVRRWRTRCPICGHACGPSDNWDPIGEMMG